MRKGNKGKIIGYLIMGGIKNDNNDLPGYCRELELELILVGVECWSWS